jgi:hypothetical protein
MDIKFVGTRHLEEILKRPPVPIIEAIQMRPERAMSVMPGKNESPSFQATWITSHDLCNMLLLLDSKIDRFGMKIQDALKELEI